MSEFATLSLEQREIVTQALFYHLDHDSLQQLFDGAILLPEIILPDPVLPSTGTTIDTGALNET